MSNSERVPVELCKGVNGLDKVVLREVRGSSAEMKADLHVEFRSKTISVVNKGLRWFMPSLAVYLYGGHVTSWKNDHGEELLFVSSKFYFELSRLWNDSDSLCRLFSSLRRQFVVFSNHGSLEQHGFARNRFWSIDTDPPPFPTNSSSKAFVDLILKPSEEDLKIWPHSFEFRLRVTLGPGGDLMLTSRIRNTNVEGKSFTFTFAYHTYFSVSDIRGEVKVLLFNHNQEEFIVRAGDRIAQIIFEKVSLPRMVEKDARNLCDIRNDDRNDARNWRSTEGFGSTGKAALEYRREDLDSDSTLNIIAMMEEEAETEYPQIAKLKALIEKRQQPQYLLSSSSAVTSHYNPPQDSMMGPPGYPPATGHGPSINIPERPSYTGVRSNFRRGAKDEMWNLPSAMHHTGAMFVIPQSLGRFDDAFMRWESITRSYVASQGFTDVRDKLLFMENLLGETEKLIWTQWRMRYADEYANLVSIGDGNEDLEREIPIPGYYKEPEKKYGVRKATTYKGKPHSSHVRIDKRNIPEDYDVMSVEPGDDDSDAIYSVSEGLDDTEQIGGGLTETIYMLREADKSYWLGKEGGYRAQIKVSPEIYHCQHEWDQQNPLPEDRRPECTTCKRDLSSYSKPLLQEQQEYIRWCEAEMKRLREEAIQYKTELEELKLIIQLQDDERELRRKGKYKEDELLNLEKEAEEAEAASVHVHFEEVPPERVLAIEEVVAGGELKEKKKNMLYNLTE
ncbi:unnamed protein product [Camellia sinensis]